MKIQKFNHKKIKRLDERLTEFLFGSCHGYLWGERCIEDRAFKRHIMQQGGFVDIHLESRMLYQEAVPFTVFHTPECEFAFNQLTWQGGNIYNLYQRKADLFLFCNHQRLITISLRQLPNFFQHKKGFAQHKIEHSQIHWTKTNVWLNNYLDFIHRIEHLINLEQTKHYWHPELSNKSCNQSLGYRIGYTLGKLVHQH